MIPLEKNISTWDEKSTNYLRSIYLQHHNRPDFAETLIRLIQSHEKGATWLIKEYLSQGNILNNAQTKSVYRAISTLKHWEAKLHILQSIPYLGIEPSSKNILYHFLSSNLSDPNKFLRAWTYNGFYLLAEQFSEYKEEVETLLETAWKNESASVRARIRNRMKGK